MAARPSATAVVPKISSISLVSGCLSENFPKTALPSVAQPKQAVASRPNWDSVIPKSLMTRSLVALNP